MSDTEAGTGVIQILMGIPNTLIEWQREQFFDSGLFAGGSLLATANVVKKIAEKYGFKTTLTPS